MVESQAGSASFRIEIPAVSWWSSGTLHGAAVTTATQRLLEPAPLPELAGARDRGRCSGGGEMDGGGGG